VTPSCRSATASRRAASSFARATSCAWICTAASGVRSSCAASATNAFCVSSAADSRASSPFSARTSGCTSSGKPRVGQRIERFRAARLHRARHAAERREAAPDDHPDRRTEERQQHDQRPQRAQRDVRGEPVAHRQRLRELHDVVADDRAVHAPFAAIGALGREAELRARRDRARGCEKYISTPLRFQIWITMPSSPLVREPNTCENGSDGSAAAISCSW
jgi:hypothetical protein